jgi:hypothetical protein
MLAQVSKVKVEYRLFWWAELKYHSTTIILYFQTLFWFYTRTTTLLFQQSKALDESFLMVSWWRLGSKCLVLPQTSQSPIVTLLLPKQSVFPDPPSKIYSAISWPRPDWNHTNNLCMVLILCFYRFSAGRGMLMVLCPDGITPCPTAILLTHRRLHWGAICTSSKHLLARPCQQNIVQKHRFSLAK